jgi:hypothetical protein
MCSVCDDFAERFKAGSVNAPQGAMAQLVERLHGMEKVAGSIPASSTPKPEHKASISSWVLAGFVAGEGTFVITTKQPGFDDGDPRLRFIFAVSVAQRDRPVLEVLMHRIGCGSIRDVPARRVHWQPTSTYTVHSIRGHRTGVIPFISRYLVSSAKRRQFDLWVDAMDAYELAHPTRWGRGRSPCSIDGCDKPVRGRGLCRSHYYQATGW